MHLSMVLPGFTTSATEITPAADTPWDYAADDLLEFESPNSLLAEASSGELDVLSDSDIEDDCDEQGHSVQNAQRQPLP